MSVGCRLWAACLLGVSMMYPNRLVAEDLTAFFDHFIEKEMAEGRVVGLSIAVVDGEDVIYSRGFGYADIEGRRLATPDRIDRISRWAALTTRLVP